MAFRWIATVFLLGPLWLLLSGSEATPPAPSPNLPPPRETAEAGDEARGAIEYVGVIDAKRLLSLQKPHSLWAKLTTWVSGPAEHPQFLRPFAVTEDSLGRMLVADPGQRVLHILDFERGDYGYIAGIRGQEFLSPIGVAVDSEDNIYVSDSARARLYVFNRKGKFLRTLGEKLDGEGLLRPTGLALDGAARRLYVADTLRHQVLVLDLNGRLLQTIGKRGTGAGEFNFPTSLVLAAGQLYVVDAMNFRVQVFERDGKVVGSFGKLGRQTGSLNRPKGIGVDTDGNIYVVDALFENVQVFDRQGQLLYYFGSTGTAPGQFVMPAGIHVTSRNQILVADSYNQRLQVFRYVRLGR